MVFTHRLGSVISEVFSNLIDSMTLRFCDTVKQAWAALFQRDTFQNSCVLFFFCLYITASEDTIALGVQIFISLRITAVYVYAYLND